MTTHETLLNGMDREALEGLIETVRRDPAEGITRWNVRTCWTGGTTTQTHVDGFEMGGRFVPRPFSIRIDEPHELGGTNRHANPQEHLLSAMNACMTVGYVAVATLMGVRLESLEITAEGRIDLRAFLGIDPTARPGYDAIRYTVRVRGSGTPEQFEQIHRTVMATSPNRFNLASAIRLDAKLIVE